jgi:hypothetical protein
MSVVLAALLVAFAIFSRNYRAPGIVLLPLYLWFSLKRDPAQMEIRPGLRVLGWILVGVAVIAIITFATVVVAGK